MKSAKSDLRIIELMPLVFDHLGYLKLSRRAEIGVRDGLINTVLLNQAANGYAGGLLHGFVQALAQAEGDPELIIFTRGLGELFAGDIPGSVFQQHQAKGSPSRAFQRSWGNLALGSEIALVTDALQTN